jgi:hypothetical protein
MKGPLRDPILDALGRDKYEHFLEDFRMTTVVSGSGELRPGYFRGIKSA